MTLKDLVDSETIDNVLEKYESISDISAALVQAPVYTALAIYGKHLQELNKLGLRPYDWWTGHLSDLFASAAAITLLTYPPCHISTSKKSERNFALTVSSVGTALAYTVYEMTGVFNSNKCDIQDIACYWAGAGIAYFGTKTLSNQINNFLKNRYVKKLAKANLEVLK